MTTTRTAAEALEEVLALEQKATPGTYRYSPWHVEEGEAAVRTSKGNLDWAITFASDNDAEFIATVVNFIRTHADTLRAALAQPQEGEPTITVSGPVACGKSFVMELIYKALRDAGLHPYSYELAHERRMVQEQPPPSAKVWHLREAVAAPQPAPAQEPVDVAASSIRNGSTNKGDKMINYTGRHKDSFDRFFASTQKEKPVGWRKDLNPPHGNFTLQWLEENPWPEQNHVQPLYAAPPPDEARELLETAKHELIWCSERRHEARVNALVERIRAYLEKHK